MVIQFKPLLPKVFQNFKVIGTAPITMPKPDPNLEFGLGKVAFSLLPLTPEFTGRRKTLFKEVVKDQVWTLDQVQGIVNVNVPVRSVVLKLKEGGLFINNPVAPTKECISMVRELEALHGPVKFITLSSVAIEHKGTTGAFAAYFPSAQVYYQPGQFSFPINLPISLFFPLGQALSEIPKDFKSSPWGDEIEHCILGPLKGPQVGGFGETAFFHKSTGTLLLTDSIVRVDEEPPEIIQDDPRALLCLARNDMFDVVRDTPDSRRLGWRRMVLFALIFQPSEYEIPDIIQSLMSTDKVTPEVKLTGRGTVPFNEGWYPFKWVRSEVPSFRALQDGLIVPPIIRQLIFNREPEKVLEWADKVSQWPIKRIIPSHMANDIQATGKDFRQAFRFLEESPSMTSTERFLGRIRFSTQNDDKAALKVNLGFLSFVDKILTNFGIVRPEAALVSRK